MSIDLNTVKKLSQTEDATRTYGFEEASDNVLYLRQGYCPQCMEPMGMQNVQGKSTIKVVTSSGIEHWCEDCFKKGNEKGLCIKYRSMDKKERKVLMKTLKKKVHGKEDR